MPLTVADNVRAELARQRLTGRQLADRIGLSQTQCSRRLRGALPWTADELLSVARALGVDVSALYAGVEPASVAEPAA